MRPIALIFSAIAGIAVYKTLAPRRTLSGTQTGNATTGVAAKPGVRPAVSPPCDPPAKPKPVEVTEPGIINNAAGDVAGGSIETPGTATPATDTVFAAPQEQE